MSFTVLSTTRRNMSALFSQRARSVAVAFCRPFEMHSVRSRERQLRIPLYTFGKASRGRRSIAPDCAKSSSVSTAAFRSVFLLLQRPATRSSIDTLPPGLSIELAGGWKVARSNFCACLSATKQNPDYYIDLKLHKTNHKIYERNSGDERSYSYEEEWYVSQTSIPKVTTRKLGKKLKRGRGA